MCSKKGAPIKKDGKIVGRRRFCAFHLNIEKEARLASYHRTKVLLGRKKKSEELSCAQPAIPA
jgi:hypothetical protein